MRRLGTKTFFIIGIQSGAWRIGWRGGTGLTPAALHAACQTFCLAWLVL